MPRILKAHSHSMSGGSIWVSFECQCYFWIAGVLVSYFTMWLLTLQSRFPSLRSSGRNVRLWVNLLPEARNPGLDWTAHFISTANQIPPWNELSHSLTFLPEDHRLGERDCWPSSYSKTALALQTPEKLRLNYLHSLSVSELSE
jgi:hypothetical protein